MKRLLIYLGLLATLLAMPYHAKADNTWAYYLYGDINGWNKDHAKTDAYFFGETSNGSDQDQPSWTKTFTGKQLDPNEDGVAYFKILLVEKNGTTTTTPNLGPSGGNQVLEVNGSAQTLHLNNSGDGAYMVTGINKDAEYTIMYVSTTRNGGTISITGPDTENKNIKLRGSYSNPDWRVSTAYTSFSDGIYTWEFDKSKFPSGTVFKLYEYVDGTNDHWYSNDSEITEDWSPEFSGDGGGTGHDMKVLYTDNDDLIKISVQAKKSNGKWKIRIVKTYEPHDYYWVSPQVTNNQKWPYFKLTALRDRSGSFGDGKISDKYFTFTIKNDDLRRYDGTAIKNGEKIEWYIARDDDEVWFRPSTENDPTPPAQEISTSLNMGHTDSYDSNIGYRNYLNCKVTDKSNTYKFAFNKGANSTKTGESDYLTNVKSYTFILNSRRSNDNTQGNVFFNYAHNSEPVTSGDCYLLGNFRSATEAEYVCNPDDPKYVDENTNPYGPRKMTQYWYYKGTKYESEHNPCDSIVYEIKVDKPANGWGNLYLDINPGSNTSWDKVYRPLISLGNTLDGRALIGGLTTAGAGMDNNEGDQSLNPETSNDYTSYTFRFNATTYTYQLEFHTSLYLVGPGVSATQGLGSWDLSNVKSSDPRIRLTATQEKDHYRNRVYFTKGQPFRFIKNTDESATPNYENSWMENDYAPKWEGASADGDYYPYNETQLQYETQYKNYLSTGSTVPSDNDNSILFDLPSGWYYVNFYPNATKPYYTIEHSMELRDFNEVYYRSAAVSGEQRTVEGRNGYNFLRVWSDHIAWNKPDNIDVFVVTAFSVDANGQATVTLTKQDGNYIPANTGVILGCKLSKDNLTSGLVYDNAATLAYTNNQDVNYYNTLTAELTPYSDPSTSYTGASKLIPLYSAESLKRFSDETGIKTGDGYANYLFGFYRRKKYVQNYTGDDKIFDLGFWLTTGEGKTYPNSAFVRILKSDAEKMGVGTAYNNIESASASKAFAPAFMLLFDESDDNIITGISDITTAKGNSVASQGWYTLQGVRIAKPTQRGIYIYNGKKVVVND